MLVVIAIIGIIAGIALPSIGSINDGATQAKNQRNAQSLASTFTTAQTAGLDFFSPGDLEDTIAKVVSGGTVSTGVFAGEFFGIPGLDLAQQDGAKPYLELQGSSLVYNAEGTP